MPGRGRFRVLVVSFGVGSESNDCTLERLVLANDTGNPFGIRLLICEPFAIMCDSSGPCPLPTGGR